MLDKLSVGLFPVQADNVILVPVQSVMSDVMITRKNFLHSFSCASSSPLYPTCRSFSMINESCFLLDVIGITG